MTELYKPFKSKSKNKRYSVYVKNDKGNTKLIHFGDSRYSVYFEHKDKQRQKNYLSRAKGIKNKKGELTYKDKNTSAYWAVKLWDNTKPSWA